MFKKAEWIWAEENDSSSGDCVFRYAFNADKRPKTAEMSVAATGACFVSVNGEYVLYAAGRDATESETFYMTADISRELKKGVNVIVARVAGGAEKNGLALECEEAGVASGSGFLVYTSRAYTRGDAVTTYNATTEHRLEGIDTAEFQSDLFRPAVPGGSAEAVLPSVRPAPIFDAGRRRGYEKTDGGIVMDTEPGAAYPRFTVTANSGDKIEITGSLGLKKLEYIARAETQSFEFDEPLYGRLTFTYPSTVKLNEAGYRLVECGAERSGRLTCDDDVIGELYEKAENNFRLCAAGAFTSLPYNKTITPLDASVMARAASYVLTGGAAYCEQLTNALLDALEGKPSWVDTENSLYTLYALSGLGLAGDCAALINSSDLKQRLLQATVAFLETFDGEADTLRAETDARYNIDYKLFADCLIGSAVRLCRAAADELGITRYDEFLSEKTAACEKKAETYLKNGGLSSGRYLHDDRANAAAVLTGAVPQYLWGDAARVMATAYCATPVWEGMVIEAMLAAGRADWALDRMAARAAVLDGDTVPSDFAREGEACRAASAGYVSAFYRGIAGIEFSDGGRRVSVTPDLNVCRRIVFSVCGGNFSGKMTKTAKGSEFVIENRTDMDAVLRLKRNKGIVTDEPIKTLELKKGKNVFKF